MGEARRRAEHRSDTVKIAWIYPGEVNGRFMESVLGLVMADARRPRHQQRIIDQGGYLAFETGPRIASARNNVVRHLLASSAEWLLMIDTDMVFEADALDRLLEVADPVERPIVGALYFGGGHSTIFPVMYRAHMPTEDDPSLIETITEWEPGSLVKVTGTGCGFLLVHRSVFEAMALHNREPYVWFAETSHGETEFGEDWTFCVRAQRIGIPVYVHTGIRMGHMKLVQLDERSWRAHVHNLASNAPEPELADA